MVLVVRPCGSSQHVPDACSSIDDLRCECETHRYSIQRRQESECALILFLRPEQVAGWHAPYPLPANDPQETACKLAEPLVIKVLHAYQDSRYDLGSLEKRQLCQLEALTQNRLFTEDVYFGLVPVEPDIYESRTTRLQFGELLPHPRRDQLIPGVEYALVMERLPDKRRLDVLLRTKHARALRPYIHRLARRIAEIHQSLPVCSEEWGSYEQLHQKLLHNYALFDLIWQNPAYADLKQRIGEIEERLLRVVERGNYRAYFQQRVAGQYIRRGHGDLKAPNIWLLAEEVPQLEEERAQGMRVALLDAADFNPCYTNIDTLSDLAMLVVDIQARTRSVELAHYLLQAYLDDTRQRRDREAAQVVRAVLAYYLTEKAIVGAAINLVYDNCPQLGHTFLTIAEERLCDLERFNLY